MDSPSVRNCGLKLPNHATLRRPVLSPRSMAANRMTTVSETADRDVNRALRERWRRVRRYDRSVEMDELRNGWRPCRSAPSRRMPRPGYGGPARPADRPPPRPSGPYRSVDADDLAQTIVATARQARADRGRGGDVDGRLPPARFWMLQFLRDNDFASLMRRPDSIVIRLRRLSRVFASSRLPRPPRPPVLPSSLPPRLPVLPGWAGRCLTAPTGWCAAPETSARRSRARDQRRGQAPGRAASRRPWGTTTSGRTLDLHTAVERQVSTLGAAGGLCGKISARRPERPC